MPRAHGSAGPVCMSSEALLPREGAVRDAAGQISPGMRSAGEGLALASRPLLRDSSGGARPGQPPSSPGVHWRCLAPASRSLSPVNSGGAPPD
ncbi:hypothetical protein NDU88_001269 [Pleurodeles waltl]|uniref:Uncharacterized protein n=1 Tax=Pleurodeles waltl TaxID=8319 RepID=A0AAV7L982_PLEWA|nr:hypothetical protein NDU88_001269 [Pleurodeles waltl]